MRMICPNCGAQYEVDANVIPETGRDVQCSNCGHTWFQRQLRDEEELEVHTEPSPEPEVEFEDHTGSELESDDTDFPVAAPEIADEPTHEESPTVAHEQQVLGEDVVGILREEAERETSERISESTEMPEQPDLGLDSGNDQANAFLQDRSTDFSEPEEEPEHSMGTVESSRRDLLPDIEEINSTLAASNQSGSDEDQDPDSQTPNGFRRGFILAIVIIAILALLYVFAGSISGAIPQTESMLIGYVAWIDGMRSAIDAMMLNSIESLTGLLAQLSGEAGN